ncbi:MAG TPA: ferredoxin--nitrite reductase, partial [Nitrospiria bacterium]
LDASPAVREYTGLFVGNRDYANLPRKFNVAVTGCRENCIPAETQDLALVPAEREVDGRTLPGFNLLAGGKVGSGGFRAAAPLDVFVPPEDAADLLGKMTLIFRDHGLRDNRNRARLAFLLEDWGAPRLRRELEARMGRPLLRAGKDMRDVRRKTDHIGIYRQKQPGLNYVGVVVPVGRITAKQMAGMAGLSETYGNGEIRLTGGQSLILPHIPDRMLGRLTQEEPLIKELSYNPPEILRGLLSCTGIEYCGMAVIETKNRALEIARKLVKQVGPTKPVEIHWSGCPAGCGNHLISDIGVIGKRTRRTKSDGTIEIVDAVDLYVGGRSGPKARSGIRMLEDVPCDQLPEVMEGLVRYVTRDKTVEMVKGEAVSFGTFGNIELKPVPASASDEGGADPKMAGAPDSARGNLS